MQTKVMIALFGLFAEVERDLISQRTKEGLAAARAKCRLLGRPKGALGKSKLDGKEEEIRMLLEKTVSKASIAEIGQVRSRPGMGSLNRTGYPGRRQVVEGVGRLRSNRLGIDRFSHGFAAVCFRIRQDYWINLYCCLRDRSDGAFS